MATANVTAQHFVECDSCEENPANFLCITCPGHLCETCKTEHEKKRMSQNHEIVNLGAGNDKVVDLLFCAKHTNKKLECFCVQCNSPVCTDCIIQAHNSHFVRALSSVYKEIRDDLSIKKKKKLTTSFYLSSVKFLQKMRLNDKHCYSGFKRLRYK